MARNLFLLAALAALAGCNTPTQPPSPSGMETSFDAAPAVEAPAVAPVPVLPADAPASQKLPLGRVRQK